MVQKQDILNKYVTPSVGRKLLSRERRNNHSAGTTAKKTKMHPSVATEFSAAPTRSSAQVSIHFSNHHMCQVSLSK